MAVSTAALLTKQFYEWEQRGRGWHKADFSVDLEPPFAPFFGHFLPEGDIIDDGRVPSFFQRLFNTAPLATEVVPSSEPELQAYPSTDNEGLTIFLIDIPKHSKAHAEQMEQLLMMLSYLRTMISFELIGTYDKLVFQLACKDRDAQYLQTQLHAFLPGFGVQETYDDHVEGLLRDSECLYTVDFGLREECMRPIAMLSGDKECYTALFGILDRLAPNESVILQILFSGVCNPWPEHLLNSVQDNDGKGSFFMDDLDMVKFAHMKVSRPLCAATIRAMTFAGTLEDAHLLLQHVTTALIHSSKSTGNSLMPLNDHTYTVQERMADLLMRESRRVGMLLNTSELCTLAHFPLVSLPKLGQRRNTKAAPAELIGNDYCIGLNVHQGVECEITLKTEHRLRHMHVLGSTGTGKSTFLHSLMMQDVELGNGFMCLDPHGDLIDKVLDTIPQARIKDVVLIDPSDNAFPIGFNILSAHNELEKELLASDLVALFRRFSTSWGDQMNSVFANAILAFLYNTKTGTLADLRRFLIEPSFRNQTLLTVTDPELSYYWQHEYPLLKSSSIGSILTRLDAFLRPKTIRNMVCQPTSLDFAKLIDNNKITITTATNTNITYTYDAAGNVLRKQQFDNSTTATYTTDYIDGFVYINGMLAYFPMPEGRVTNNGGTLTQEFIITDQQGNARVSFNNSGTGGTAKVVQENSYYGTGLAMIPIVTGSNKKLYNGGSEWQNDYNKLPDYYQTLYRNYDAATARFVGVDPEAEGAESMTDYQYAGNNPIMGNDPMGNIYAAHQFNPYPAPQMPIGWSIDPEDQSGGGGGGGAGFYDPDDNIGRNAPLTGAAYTQNWLNTQELIANGGLYAINPGAAILQGQQLAQQLSQNSANNGNTSNSAIIAVIQALSTLESGNPIEGGGLGITIINHQLTFAITDPYADGAIVSNVPLSESDLIDLIENQASQGGSSWISDALNWMGDHFYTEVSGRLTQGAIGFTSGRFAGSEIDLGKHNLATLTTGTDKGGINAYKDDGTIIYGGQLVVPVFDVPVGIGATHDVNSGQNSGILGIGAFGYERTGNSNFIGLDMTSGVNLYFLGIESTAKIGFKW
jgi:RHS repeat-associated protein